MYLPSAPGAAGSATSSAGAIMPGSRTQPGYQSDEDWNNIAMATLLGEKNRGVVQAIQGTPGHKAREAYQTGIAKNNASLEERQRAGKDAVIPGMQTLREHLSGVPSEEWRHSFGEYNAEKQPAANEVPLNYKAWRAPDMPPVQARSAYGLLSGPTEQKQFGRFNTADHLADAVTEATVAAGKLGQIASSDTRMQLFQSLLKKSLLAPTREEGLGILDHAENIARHTFGLPAKPGTKEAPYQVSRPELSHNLPKGSHYVLPIDTVINGKTIPRGTMMQIPY